MYRSSAACPLYIGIKVDIIIEQNICQKLRNYGVCKEMLDFLRIIAIMMPSEAKRFAKCNLLMPNCFRNPQQQEVPSCTEPEKGCSIRISCLSGSIFP